MIRVLVVDDHPVIRGGLAALLSGEPDLQVVASAASGEEALAMVDDVRPSLVLCDLRLGPGIDGVEVTTALRALPDPPAVLILTTFDNDSDIVRAVMAGAAGYLLKDAPAEAIADGIRDAIAGRLVLTPELLGRVSDRMTKGVPDLSERELAVLREVALGRTNREVAKALFISEATVKTHLVHAYSKLGAGNRTEALARARDHGLLG
ncbi:response regulator [Propioniciclava tarda]|uniref:Response regulator transcription factor n=1 Tax=Propioniciclava tarda TaxID=433330 RepID=A0A4V2JTD4_PROTD|nr:response regulator transcription factor [Propioniciclava tarda]TBT95871.1 response regulator transcription factor [Propioniciclava tarda]SMO40873.1 two component transcriptional regulator, LuxR family [Propioniciclava tarda]HOA89485.1 response regulator transcription factor [Propioniciclava tarda]HQA30696.1 response regulator transcription factor [Propioniciclava tarda]HQD60602.1 response regulator transcription factor [Propioniciclava tarda]